METKKKFWTPASTLVATYTFSWGFAALDRLLIAMLFPFVIPAFGLNYAQAGLIMTCMSVLYLIMASLGGVLSDKFGRKKVILPAVIIFSLGSFLTGFATGFASLIAIRAIIGGAEGAFYTSAAAQIAEQSSDEKRGASLGIFNSAFALFGAFFASIYATQIASRWGWNWACYLTIIPGIILCLVIVGKVKDTHQSVSSSISEKPAVSFFEAFKERNIILSVFLSATWFIWLWSWLSYGLLYFTKERGMETGVAGILISALGFGGFLGGILMGQFSDKFGRKASTFVGILLGFLGTITIVMVPNIPFALQLIIILITAAGAWGSGNVFLQIIPSDCISRAHLAKTLGAIVSIGEFVGIAVAPPILGAVGDKFGLAATMQLGAISLIVTIILILCLRESAPKFCKKVTEEVTAAL